MKRLENIRPLDIKAQNECQTRWNAVAMPREGFGILQQQFVRIAGITGSADVCVKRSGVAVMCADNGVTAEGVTQTDSSVTAVVAADINSGKSTANALAIGMDCAVCAFDMGMNSDVMNVPKYKTACGTQNITKTAAMSVQQAEFAIKSGMDIVKRFSENGCKILVAGEMGIGNTTTASAISSVLLGRSVEEMTGRGAGLDSEGLKRKISAVRRAIETNVLDKSKPIELLSKLGGFDIAGMVGLYLGGAVYRMPIVIDGVVSAVAAALAVCVKPECRDFMLASHISAEPSGKALLDFIGVTAPITAEMHLGEGTGGIMLLRMLEGVEDVYTKAHHFVQSGIDPYKELK